MTDGTSNPGRDTQGRFGPGNPGGPGGARRRATELRRAAEEAVSADHVAALIRKATRMGLEGNLTAMRLVLERVCGRAAEAPVEAEPLGIALPRLRTAADCTQALDRLIEGICQGTADRDTTKMLMDAIQIRLKAIEVNDLEVRLAQLEEGAKLTMVGRR